MSDRYKGAILSPTAPIVTPQSAGGVFTLSQQTQYQGQGVWPSYGTQLTKSLRFRSSASAYLSNTSVSPTLGTKSTYSIWVKRGALSGTMMALLDADQNGAGASYDELGFESNNTLYFYSQGASAVLNTSAVYRDSSAWYHIVLAIDTTQSTAANRVLLYVNGIQVTAFSSAGYPTQNYVPQFQVSGRPRFIGQRYNGSPYFDGYIAEVNFIDGQALTPSSFGMTNAAGTWSPIGYSGSYGNNGFYLPFTNTTSTSTLGNDFSGNGNTFTVNNISLTPGSTYDSMTDVPTLTNATTANYAVWNPITVGTATVTNGNLTSTGAASTGNLSSILIPSSGKWYAEFTWSGSGVGTPDIGIFSADVAITASSARCQYRSDGSKVVDATVTGGYGATYTNGDVIAVAVDVDSNTVTFYKNNASQGAITYTSSNGRYAFNVIAPNSNWILNANFGQRPFTYTPPAGFVALNTFNLAGGNIVRGNQYFDATTYTGTGSSLSITNSGSMQPDFVWIKNRSSATYHWLTNAITGTAKQLTSNASDAESSYTQILTAFNSNGFTVGTDGDVNANGSSYVGWQWRGANGTVTNTVGSISSQVSANTTAGFSIVTYTGNGTSGATVGHGLGVTPSMVILKQRDGASNWQVKHVSLNANQNLILNSTAAVDTAPGSGYISAISSTTLTLLNGGSAITNVNANNGTYVAYCFAPVAGYSAFGSYTGNGSNDGPFIFTGFRPRWLFVKKSSGTSYWQCLDTSRSPYNLAGEDLIFDLPDAEKTIAQGFNHADILSNGFKIRNTNCNDSGATYIFGAFAENPFKYANAR